MSDRPIIFSAPMVRALLAGRKTQTRRLASSPLRRVRAGDRLYVRESFAVKRFEPCEPHERDWQSLSRPTIRYIADGIEIEAAEHGDRSTGRGIYHGPVEKGRPCIHMPRWASRLTLIVEEVRNLPLCSITEKDAEAEGVVWDSADGYDVWYVSGASLPHTATAAECFSGLWGSLHSTLGERWADNPEVVALTFRVERANIDQVSA